MGNVSRRRAASLGRVVVTVLVGVTVFAPALISVGVPRGVGELIRGISAGGSIVVAGRCPGGRRGRHGGRVVGRHRLGAIIIKGGVGGSPRGEGGGNFVGMGSGGRAGLARGRAGGGLRRGRDWEGAVGVAGRRGVRRHVRAIVGSW